MIEKISKEQFFKKIKSMKDNYLALLHLNNSKGSQIRYIDMNIFSAITELIFDVKDDSSVFAWHIYKRNW